MKRIDMRFIFSTIYLLAFVGSIARGEERPGKAIFETSSELGMKIREKALANIGVTTVDLPNLNASIPIGALVSFQDKVGVYRLREGWFKLVRVEVIRSSEKEVAVRSSELKLGDKIAVHGVGLLRVSEMDAFGGGE